MSGFSTRAIRAASRTPLLDQRPGSVPIYQAVTFSARDSDELGAILTGAQAGYAYSRIDNPTTAVLGAALADLEGAEAGFAFATGMAAIHAALLSVVSAGDRIVATSAVYGSTRHLLLEVFGRLGVSTEFVDPTDLAAVEATVAAAPTRVLYLETISNPTIVVADLAALAAIAHRHGAIVIVDNTFASPYLCRPLELGADLVAHSGTKYLGGHGDVLAGAVVGSAKRVEAIRSVEVDTGASLAPFSAFLVLRGIETLAVRVERHSETAIALASWLQESNGVGSVYYPGLESHPQHAVAMREFAAAGPPDGRRRTPFGGMLAFELAGGREAGRAFLDVLEIPERTASLGAVHTMVVHPPSTTHRQLDSAALAAAGIAPGLLRCSVGLEDFEDLRADFDQALRAAAAVSVSSSSADTPATAASGAQQADATPVAR